MATECRPVRPPASARWIFRRRRLRCYNQQVAGPELHRRRPLTLEHVARVAGVSKSTVSRVVNDVPTVDPAVRAAVQQAIAETGYVPNRAARSLVTRRTGSVALIISDPSGRHGHEPFFGRMFTDPFFGRVVSGALSVLRPAGVQLVLMPAEDEAARAQVSSYVRQGHVDGVLIIANQDGDDDALFAELRTYGVLAVLSSRPTEPGLSYVDFAQAAGGRLAAAHLVKIGRRRIASIGGPVDMPATDRRLAGLRETLRQHGLAELACVPGSLTRESGMAAMTELLAAHPDIDGLFAANDLMAEGALPVLREAGRHVPRDVAVVGFDDSSAALTSRPQLTTVRQPVEDMAAEMARLLLAQIEQPGSPPMSRVFEPTLVLRESA